MTERSRGLLAKGQQLRKSGEWPEFRRKHHSAAAPAARTAPFDPLARNRMDLFPSGGDEDFPRFARPCETPARAFSRAVPKIAAGPFSSA
ncbi:hypothetical protein [Amycolatopsis silviterrae]|uniref:Uncharacterized protein n=1 Tax=Amycolatopsis silviterrae TaxID=1656914 RepID=A0ABW5H355_9PSEU